MSTKNVNEEIPQPEFEEERPDERYVSTTPYFTIIILVSIAVVFLSELTLPMIAVREIAGLEKSLFKQGEFWRLFTSAVVHDGIVHVLFNGYALLILGRLTETISHRSNVPLVFTIAAICGGLLSTFFLPDGNSVGASGGVIGLLGFLTVYGFKRRKLLTNSLLKNMLFNIVLITVLGVFVIPNVDNFGHLGGLIAGGALGAVIIPGDLYEDPRVTGKALNYLGIGALLFVIFTAAVTVAKILSYSFLVR